MTEKRFRVRFEQEDGRGEIVNEKGVELTAREAGDLLNEQQALINALKKENKKLKEELKKGFDVPIPYVENSLRRLRAEHKVDEQQATIEHLKKRIKLISDELYCKDRKLEELGVSIECCDKDE